MAISKWMDQLDDMELVCRYAETSSEEAFAMLVTRYVDMVHSAAMRQVHDPHLAEEITQTVFVLLARKARSLTRETLLAGWLHRAIRFTASDTLRSQRRRMSRETQAMDNFSANQDDRPWQDIEPRLDEALEGLGEQDRQALLLRFFRKLSLKDLGQKLGITEDAAQKRVARAVDRLRDFYARRGATVSASALAAMLGVHAVQAAPAALTATILSAATGVAAGLASSTLPMTAMKLILTTKAKTAAITLALAAVATSTVIQQNTAKRLRQENAELGEEVQGLQASLSARPVFAAKELIGEQDLEQLRRQAAEVHQLRGEVALLRRLNLELVAGATPQTERTEADDPDATAGLDPMERMNLGKELLRQGRPADALGHYLWCFDEGLKASPAFAGVRLSFLLKEIAELGNAYPPAREALRTRRDTLEARLEPGSSDAYQILELTALNEKLNEPQKNLELAGRLDPGGPARATIYRGVADQLIAEQRYAELVDVAAPEDVYGHQLATLETTQKLLEGKPTAALAREGLRQNLFKTGVAGVEALAGAGYTERALALARQILSADGSPDTRKLLIERAQIAGNSELVEALTETPLR